MLIVDKHCSDICCDEFSMLEVIANVNNQMNSDMKNSICNQYGERYPHFQAPKMSKFVDEQQS